MSLDILFYILGGLTIGTAMMVVLSQHPIRSVLYLVLTFFMISAHYVLMNAQFLAIVNIIVYAGAIMVLFLFVLMFLNLKKENEPKHVPKMTIGAAIAGGALFLVIVAALKDAFLAKPMIDSNSPAAGLVENLGNLLFTKYVLPFEVSSVLFLAAMVGAVLLAKREKTNN
jgi:NADH-quinone oxidoreductase subunit J